MQKMLFFKIVISNGEYVLICANIGLRKKNMIILIATFPVIMEHTVISK